MSIKIQKQNLCEQLTSAIIHYIQEGTWLLGQKLPGEIELANSFEVSRNIMREALKILENFGILDAKNGIGTFVSPNALENIQNMNFFYSLKDNTSVEMILEMRLMVEPDAAYFAALRIQENRIAELKKLSEEQIKKYETFPDYQDDFDLHLAIAHYSGNILCENFCHSLLKQLQNSLYSEFNKYSSTKTREDNISAHTAIVNAIIEHKAELAHHLMKDHLINRLKLINPDFEDSIFPENQS